MPTPQPKPTAFGLIDVGGQVYAHIGDMVARVRGIADEHEADALKALQEGSARAAQLLVASAARFRQFADTLEAAAQEWRAGRAAPDDVPVG